MPLRSYSCLISTFRDSEDSFDFFSHSPLIALSLSLPPSNPLSSPSHRPIPHHYLPPLLILALLLSLSSQLACSSRSPACRSFVFLNNWKKVLLTSEIIDSDQNNSDGRLEFCNESIFILQTKSKNNFASINSAIRLQRIDLIFSSLSQIRIVIIMA